MPEAVREILVFLKFINWYCRFIHRYTWITVSLTNLLRKPKDRPARIVKDKSLVIIAKAHKAINLLKKKFTEIIQLTYFLKNLLSQVETDTSRRGLAGVLT